jgi:hypothetical protein
LDNAPRFVDQSGKDEYETNNGAGQVEERRKHHWGAREIIEAPHGGLVQSARLKESGRVS